MNKFNTTLASNPQAAKWFKLLNENEKGTISPIFEQVINTAEYFNDIFPGGQRFQIYITGSTLNLLERSYNDIDLMVVVPEQALKINHEAVIKDLWDNFRNNNLLAIQKMVKDPKIKMFDLSELIKTINDSIQYQQAIMNQDKETLLRHLGSINEVSRISMDPGAELSANKMRIEGMITAEKNKAILDSDSIHGYQFGNLVEEFLKHIYIGLSTPGQDGQPLFSFHWSKSFSEGYGKTAGNNNFHIYSRSKCVPVHVFLTTGVDQKKAMEKKESFMLEYYSEHERMQPIKIL